MKEAKDRHARTARKLQQERDEAREETAAWKARVAELRAGSEGFRA